MYPLLFYYIIMALPGLTPPHVCVWRQDLDFFLAHSVVVIVVFNDLRSDVVVVLFVDIGGIAGNNYLVLFYNMLIVAECYSTIVFNNKIIIRITLLLTLHR